MFRHADIGSVYVGGYGWCLSESGLCVFRAWCPTGFHVVGESPSVYVVVCSHVVC